MSRTFFSIRARSAGDLLRRYRLELALTVLLVILAAAVRLPYLNLIPRFTDETIDTTWSAVLARGAWWPLRFNALDYYRGPIFEYLVAGLFRLLGMNPEIPRAATLAFGALTVGLTFWLGRLMRGWLAGLIAAALLLTSPSHILVNSHVAWASCVTPFFTTIGLGLFYHGVQNRRKGWLPVSTFCMALGLQTHPLVALFLLPLLLWFLARRQILDWFRSPYLYLALLTGLLGYGNMLWFNVTSGFAAFQLGASRSYAFQIAPDAATFLDNLIACISQLFSLLSNNLGRLSNPAWYLVQFPDALFIWAILIGLAYAAWRGNGFLLTIIVGYSLSLAYINQDYSFFQTRYLTALLPLAFVAFGILVQDAVNALRSHLVLTGGQKFSQNKWLAPAGLAAISIGMIIVLSAGMLHLQEYYQRDATRGYTNAPYMSIASRIALRPNPAAPVLIGDDLDGITWRFGGIAKRAIAYPLDVWNQPYAVVPVDSLPDVVEKLPAREAYFVITPRTFTALKVNLPGYRFEELEVSTAQQEGIPNRIGLYRLISRP